MFTSGKFKNTVGSTEDTVLIVPGASLQKRYVLVPTRGPARQWLALEEAFGRESVLAPSTSLEELFGKTPPLPLTSPQQQQQGGPNAPRNVFAIIVSYYVKVGFPIYYCFRSSVIPSFNVYAYWSTIYENINICLGVTKHLV